jgi:hypothetical protein
MDFATIAAGIVTAIVPYLAKKVDKLIDKTVDEGFEQRGKIWETAKGLFQEDDLTLLNLFEENPSDAKTQGKIEVKLEDKLRANPDAARELDDLLKDLPAETATNSVNIRGDQNKVAQGNSNSTITIS